MKKSFLLLFFWTHFCLAQAKKYSIHTLAFYNFENCFDTIDGPNDDQEWLPDGKENWTGRKYTQKLENLSLVLSKIGINEQQKNTPTFIGGAEIENRGVLKDLIKTKNLIASDYGILHFDSPDRRGIDVALLYKKTHFKVASAKAIPLVWDDATKKQKMLFSRDVLLVTGFLDGEEINILVNHWPSRAGGEAKTAPARALAGRLNKKIVDSIYKKNPLAKIIIMGDLNDTPQDKSLKENLMTFNDKKTTPNFGIYNPFEKMAKEGNATIFFRDVGMIFDQILVSKNLINLDFNGFQLWKAGVFSSLFMIETAGKYKGYPIRHSSNEVGFSDHLPVYIYLIKELK
jgi:endonuclease/exonuclease/phosphatase family metal-dependent hydrolase